MTSWHFTFGRRWPRFLPRARDDPASSASQSRPTRVFVQFQASPRLISPARPQVQPSHLAPNGPEESRGSQIALSRSLPAISRPGNAGLSLKFQGPNDAWTDPWIHGHSTRLTGLSLAR